jgi:hypothetical protein
VLIFEQVVEAVFSIVTILGCAGWEFNFKLFTEVDGLPIPDIVGAGHFAVIGKPRAIIPAILATMLCSQAFIAFHAKRDFAIRRIFQLCAAFPTVHGCIIEAFPRKSYGKNL